MLPKSLHTVTVLAAFAVALRKRAGTLTREEALDAALAALGYPTTPDADPYGLRAKALVAVARTEARS